MPTSYSPVTTTSAGRSASPRRIRTWRSTLPPPGYVVLRRRSRARAGESGDIAAYRVGDRVEHLVLDHDRVGRAAGGLRVVGGDDRDGLAGVAHLVDREHRLVGELEAVGLAAGHVVVREHGGDAGDRQRRPDVDAADPRARVRAAQRGAPQHAVRPQVGRVRELAGDLGDAVRAPRAVADAPGARCRCRPGGWSVVVMRACRPPRCREPHGVEDLLVAGAAAQVAGQRLADLGVARRRDRAPAGRGPPRSGRACRSRTARRRRRGTPAGPGASSVRRPPALRRCARCGPAPGRPRPGRRRRARRPGRPSTSRIRPARRRSSCRAGPAARAARRAGSRPARRRRPAASAPFTSKESASCCVTPSQVQLRVRRASTATAWRR